jgi:hypothetical protein
MGVSSSARVVSKNTPSGNILDNDIRPTIENSKFRIFVCFTAAGKFTVRQSVEDKTLNTSMNNGSDLVADAGYIFEIPVRADATYNFRYTGSTGKTEILQIEEISP